MGISRILRTIKHKGVMKHDENLSCAVLVYGDSPGKYDGLYGSNRLGPVSYTHLCKINAATPVFFSYVFYSHWLRMISYAIFQVLSRCLLKNMYS